jgi:hypothetical protein
MSSPSSEVKEPSEPSSILIEFEDPVDEDLDYPERPPLAEEPEEVEGGGDTGRGDGGDGGDGGDEDEEEVEPPPEHKHRRYPWSRKDKSNLEKTSPEKTNLEKKSEVAINKAMSTIKEMSNRVSSTIENLETRPNSVEVGFGIKFDATVGVMVAKVETEASMTIMLKWEMEKAK